MKQSELRLYRNSVSVSACIQRPLVVSYSNA